MSAFKPYERVTMRDERGRKQGGYFLGETNEPLYWRGVYFVFVDFDSLGLCECDPRTLERAPMRRCRARGLRP